MKATTSFLKRRSFLKTGALAGAPCVIPARLLGSKSPSNTITLGFIGMGGQGTGRNLGTFLHEKDCRALAVCDVKTPHARRAKDKVDKQYKNSDCTVHRDFREVIARDDLDAIVISTPDHWHVPMSLMALRAGKDVFSEKPSLTIVEGRALATEVARRKAIFQWGIEDRSLVKYHRLAGWARSGAIGDLEEIHVSLAHKKALPKDKPTAVPEDLDWNLWLGPAPFRPYEASITGPQNWRNITDYSGGSLTDWGAHLVDTAQIGAGMDASGPIEVSGSSRELEAGKWQSNAPTNYTLEYTYANGVKMFVKDAGVDIRFVGSKGWVKCSGWNGTWKASDEKIFKIKEFGREARFWPRPDIEHRDFLDSMKSRKPTAYHPEAGHRLFSALHLGHIAIHTGKKVTWDPVKESFGDPELVKNFIYRRESRDWASA